MTLQWWNLQWKKSKDPKESFFRRQWIICICIFTRCLYFNEPVRLDKTPGKENPKILSEKKTNKNVSTEAVRCHLPSGLQSLPKDMQSQNENKIKNSLCSRCRKNYMHVFREEFVSNIKRLNSANENLWKWDEIL